MSRWKLPCAASPISFPRLTAILAMGAMAALAQSPAASLAHLPLGFEANQGQTSAQVRYLARSRGSVVFLTARGMTIKTPDGALAMQFAGASAAPRSEARQALPGAVHYMVGRRTLTAHRYRQVRFANVYPGVGVRYYGRGGEVEFDLDLAPHASPAQVRMRWQGVTPHLAADGGLTLGDGIGLRAPQAYQMVNGRRHAVPVRYRIASDRTVRLQLGAYDAAQPLVVDPVLSFSSVLGGTAYNAATGVAVDGSGNGYIAGYTLSADFPTVNPIQKSLAAGQFGPAYDAFVAEISPDGTALVYSTYLGGSGDDRATGIAVDSTGAAYVTGYTSSTDFPTASPIQAANGGGYDAFLAKLAPNGASLVYSTYLGGPSDDRASGVAIDGANEAFITGTTAGGFPVSLNAAQPSFGGNTDAFVAGFNASGTEIYATYLGGSGADRGNAIALDTVGNAYVGGWTASTDFPVSSATQSTFGGGKSDGFVAQLSHSGSYGWVTYLGGTGADEVNALAVDTAGNVFAAGDTTSGNLFCATAGGCGSNLGAGGDGFVAKLNNTDTNVIGAYTGAAPGGSANAVAVDNSDNVYVAGTTSSSSLPVSSNASQTTSGGVADGFLQKWDATLGVDGKTPSQVFFTYLGGSGNDAITGLGIQSNGDFDVVGWTSSPNFPVTKGVVQATVNSQTDAFVARYVIAAQGVFSPPAMGFPAQAPSVKSAPQSVTFTNGGELPLVISKIATTGPYTETDTCSANASTLQPGDSCSISIVFTPTAAGSQNGTLVITDNSPSGSETLPLSGSGGDFSITVSPTSSTIAAGSSASFAVEVAPATGFTGVVTLSCTGIGSQQNATCTPSPTSLTMNGSTASTATMTVTTTIRPSAVPWFPQPPSGPWMWLALLGLALTLAGAAYGLRARGVRRRLGWVGTAVLLGLSLAAAGCGGSTTNPGTAAGNYTLTFTGTSGQSTHSQTVTLTVN